MIRRHEWAKPVRTAYRTERVCWTCGLVKVTRHEPGVRPWVEFERRGQVLRGMTATPKCEVVR